jgi:type II secretory pathway component PulF
VSTDRAKTWLVTYLLPFVDGPNATPDRKAKGYFRHQSIITASSKKEIVRDIVAKTAIPVLIKEIKPGNWLFGGKADKGFRQQFLLSLIFSVDGGTSPGRALESAIEMETGPMRERLNIALDALRQGNSFLVALRAVQLFDSTTMAILEAGEETGTLRQALSTAAEHLNKGNEAKKLILGAIAWTALDVFFAVSSIISTRTGLIPYIREQSSGTPKEAAEMGHSLDTATTLNDILIGVTLVLALALTAAVAGYFSDDESFRQRIDAILLKTPIVRDLMSHTAIAGTCGVMASLLRGGVTFIPATMIAERGTRMMSVVNYWKLARNRVETGESPAAATAVEPFTDTEKMILRSHKDSSQLAKAYQLIGQERDELSKVASRRFARWAFLGSLAYSMLGVLLVLYVVYLQDQSTTIGTYAGG